MSAGTLGGSGALIRGHEFHYASLMSAGDDEPFAEIAAGAAKHRSKLVAGVAASPARSFTRLPWRMDRRQPPLSAAKARRCRDRRRNRY